MNAEGTQQRLISDEVGYIRNSVKATVDAYDGSVEIFEFDTEDPVLKAWEGVFPDVVKPESEISDELRAHFRYPQDMFKVQRSILARYHVDDPNVFFNNDAFWSVPADPTGADQENLDQPPYYVVAAEPETGEPTFQLITSFRGLSREFLSAHMTASSDPDSYGEITVRVLPTNTQTQGPKQAQDAMMSSDQVARDMTLWRGSNDLHNGNLLALPVGGGEILYMERFTRSVRTRLRPSRSCCVFWFPTRAALVMHQPWMPRLSRWVLIPTQFRTSRLLMMAAMPAPIRTPMSSLLMKHQLRMTPQPLHCLKTLRKL